MTRNKILRAVAAIVGSGISTSAGLGVILLLAAAPTSGAIDWSIALSRGFEFGVVVGLVACCLPHNYQTVQSYLACGVSFFIVMVAFLALFGPADAKFFNLAGIFGIFLTSCFGAFISGAGYQTGAEVSESLFKRRR